MPAILAMLLGLALLSVVGLEVLLAFHSWPHIVPSLRSVEEDRRSLALMAIGFWVGQGLFIIALIAGYAWVISGQIALTMH